MIYPTALMGWIDVPTRNMTAGADRPREGQPMGQRNAGKVVSAAGDNCTGADKSEGKRRDEFRDTRFHVYGHCIALVL